MKNKLIFVLFIVILLIAPMISAQTYSGFDRFADNVKMFFSSGDKKVMLALEIREKEVDSAIENNKNENTEAATENLERARTRLQFVQNKVSETIAEDVKINVDETISKLGVEERLPKIFETYLLEEEKTGLTAELIIEVEGKEGQTLTREVVQDEGSGQNKIMVVVEGESAGQIQEQTRTREIETRMNEIDDAIADIIVKSMVVESGMDTDDLDKRDPDATPKTPAGEPLGGVDPGPQGIVGSDHEQGVADDSSSGSDSGGDSSSSDDGGDSGGGMTGEVIKNIEKESFLKKIFKSIF